MSLLGLTYTWYYLFRKCRKLVVSEMVESGELRKMEKKTKGAIGAIFSSFLPHSKIRCANQILAPHPFEFSARIACSSGTKLSNSVHTVDFLVRHLQKILCWALLYERIFGFLHEYFYNFFQVFLLIFFGYFMLFWLYLIFYSSDIFCILIFSGYIYIYIYFVIDNFSKIFVGLATFGQIIFVMYQIIFNIGLPQRKIF